MYKVTKIIYFSYGHRLLDHASKCRFLHGHNGQLEIDIESEALNGKGMVWDFGEIKREVVAWIDGNLDHRMILCKTDPMLGILQEQGEPVFVTEQNPTAEVIAELVFRFAVERGLPVREVRLWETPSSCATFNREKAGA
jgi:6-pyruvoyltetrahydropterin/6-carboxytetrahydropterin synthase